MAISRTKLRTLKRWVNDNEEKEIATFYMESDKSGCQAKVKGNKDFLLNGLIHAIADFAVRFNISSEEITGKIVGLIGEKKRVNNDG